MLVHARFTGAGSDLVKHGLDRLPPAWFSGHGGTAPPVWPWKDPRQLHNRLGSWNDDPDMT